MRLFGYSVVMTMVLLITTGCGPEGEESAFEDKDRPKSVESGD